MALLDPCLYLIEALLAEEPRYADVAIPSLPQRRWQLLRSLMNVRPPRPISADFLAVQDPFLRQLTAEKGITRLADLTPASRDPRLYLWQGDITTLQCGAIVNAANSALLGCFAPGHGCIDKATHIRITHPSSCITASC